LFLLGRLSCPSIFLMSATSQSLCNEVKGKSMLALSRDLGVQYKTAFVLARKLREAMVSALRGLTIGSKGKVAEIDGLGPWRYRISDGPWAMSRFLRLLAAGGSRLDHPPSHAPRRVTRSVVSVARFNEPSTVL